MTDGLARKVYLAEIAAVRQHLAEQQQPATPTAQPQTPGTPATPATPHVLTEIGYERTRQDAALGQQDHRDGTGPEQQLLPGWNALDLAHFVRSTCHLNTQMGIASWRDIFSEQVCKALITHDSARLRAELVRTAALAVNWIEAIDRRTNRPAPQEPRP
ncbi:hypothetical protein O3S80_49215 [Streptomyces sp. Lzd4kr]|nr:hypothetical protein [Streptomyces sp. Lzd4kr]